MIQTLIIGKESNLSQQLASKIENSTLVSSRKIKENIEILSKYKDKKINVIFNNFQVSRELNNLKNSSDYITNAILITSKILEYFKHSDINKIIYTSSSSVYGNNICCRESDEVKPLNLHSSLKIANEKLIEKFCSEKNINFTITRIFNMYGGDDKFSVVSKILDAAKKDESITIVNHGNAIRDFIHIADVVKIYVTLLKINIPLINIGTGEGVSIKTLIDYLELQGVKLKVENIFRDELKVSTSESKLLTELTGIQSFKSVQEYLSNELDL